MRLIGCLFLLSGWMIALAALLLLQETGQRLAFVVAALGVEGLGLGVLLRSYASVGGAR